MTGGRIEFLGDSCLSIAFDQRVDPAVNDRCVALAQSLLAERRVGVKDVVPGFHTVSIYFDPLSVDRKDLAADVQRLSDAVAPVTGEPHPLLEMPVNYGGEDGPDLPAVAAFAKCSEMEAVRMHTLPVYRVYMLGFLPGFAYLGSVDPRIAMPRLAAPRIKVAAGSVGIAGEQTAVYPCDSPGGWRIIGRTPLKMFDASWPRPSRLQPGQRVKFIAV
jgi:inhibitor of KinA